MEPVLGALSLWFASLGTEIRSLFRMTQLSALTGGTEEAMNLLLTKGMSTTV